MSKAFLGIVLGGLVPALCFGLSSVFAKSSAVAGISSALYTFLAGIAVASVGLTMYLWDPDSTLSTRSALYAALAGSCWAVGAGCLSYALTRYSIPVSKLVPLHNMNALVAIAIGLIFFAEWNEVQVAKLLLGSALIIVGGVIVSNS
jgi:uncharacterized membrane protein